MEVFHITLIQHIRKNGEITFDDAPGFLIQFDMGNTKYFSISLRYEDISYTPDRPVIDLGAGEIKTKVDGSSMG